MRKPIITSQAGAYSTMLYERTDYPEQGADSYIVEGVYMHKSGAAVRHYGNHYTRGLMRGTTLWMNWNGATYYRRYKKVFTERGTAMICAQFIKEVIKNALS